MADTPAGSHAHAYTAPQAPDSAVTRGQFLTLSSVGLGAMIGAVIGVPATASVLAPFKPTAATYVEDPAEPNTSAGLAWVHYTGKQNHNWLATDAMFVVFSNRCMHLGCPVLATPQGFACPCHGGQYDTRGVRTAGPPIRPLDRFQWEIRKGVLVITQRWSVDYINGQLTYFPVKMPGQPVNIPGPFGDHTANVLYAPVTYTHGPVPKPQ